MSKKDYVATAQIIRKRTINNPLNEGLILKSDLVSDLAHLFETDNHLFSALKFIDACYGKKRIKKGR